MHAAALGAELQAKSIIIPLRPGHFSAWGMLTTQPRVDLLRTRVVRTADAPPDEIETVFRDLEAEALARFRFDGQSEHGCGKGQRGQPGRVVAGCQGIANVQVVDFRDRDDAARSRLVYGFLCLSLHEDQAADACRFPVTHVPL